MFTESVTRCLQAVAGHYYHLSGHQDSKHDKRSSNDDEGSGSQAGIRGRIQYIRDPQQGGITACVTPNTWHVAANPSNSLSLPAAEAPVAQTAATRTTLGPPRFGAAATGKGHHVNVQTAQPPKGPGPPSWPMMVAPISEGDNSTLYKSTSGNRTPTSLGSHTVFIPASTEHHVTAAGNGKKLAGSATAPSSLATQSTATTATADGRPYQLPAGTGKLHGSSRGRSSDTADLAVAGNRLYHPSSSMRSTSAGGTHPDTAFLNHQQVPVPGSSLPETDDQETEFSDEFWLPATPLLPYDAMRSGSETHAESGHMQ